MAGDVRREADCAAMVAAAVQHFGRLDCAVNNAAVVGFAPITEETQESFDLHVDTNLRGVFNCDHRQSHRQCQ